MHEVDVEKVRAVFAAEGLDVMAAVVVRGVAGLDDGLDGCRADVDGKHAHLGVVSADRGHLLKGRPFLQ